MLEVSGEEMQTLAMDHHGLVAAICKELGIADKINEKLFKEAQQQDRVVKPGQAVIAMILNGLGFTNRRLYLTHQFFEGKPVERLLDAPIQASDLTDYTLSHTLDEIAAYGTTKLFGEVAFKIALEHDVLGTLNHLDTTSMVVHGEYDIEDKASTIEITRGYSKDYRPDLKQVVLSLIVNGPAEIPLWMEPLSGNSSDKKSFHETIGKVIAFQNQIDCKTEFKWVGDSALYGKEGLLKDNGYVWLTRVPETILEAKALVSQSQKSFVWEDHDKGYATTSTMSEYGGISQRWLLVFSKQAYEREKKTFMKKLAKQEEELTKAIWHLSNETFGCEEDAKKSLKAIQKKHPLYEIEWQITAQYKHGKSGRPKAGTEAVFSGYQIQASIKKDEKKVEAMLHSKGRFILATNDLDTSKYSDKQMLEEYKSQQDVEKGFRFLKDPWFMVDSIFLKLPHRIEALMMVMTLCLLVYNLAQYKLRSKLKEERETLPNQIGKKIDNPTMRWIFQLMENIAIVRFYDASNVLIKECITNLNELRKKIISLMGQTAAQMYGLVIQKILLQV